jgi:hypothetical protein
MQIVRANPYPSLPVVHETPREHPVAETAVTHVQPAGTESRRTTLPAEEINSAERMLNRQRAQTVYGSSVQESRQHRAVAAYQSMQQSDELAYVSEVLGVDVYA